MLTVVETPLLSLKQHKERIYMSSLNKKSKVNSARITRKNKIESIRKSLNLGTKNKPETFFLRKEMEAICFSITGSIVPTNCQTSVMFKKQLLPYGYYSQKTVDSHPVVANLDLIIKKLAQSENLRV